MRTGEGMRHVIAAVFVAGTVKDAALVVRLQCGHSSCSEPSRAFFQNLKRVLRGGGRRTTVPISGAAVNKHEASNLTSFGCRRFRGQPTVAQYSRVVVRVWPPRRLNSQVNKPDILATDLFS